METDTDIRERMIRDYTAEKNWWSRRDPTEEVEAIISFSGKHSTVKEEIEYCERAIDALEKGARIEDWIY